MEFSLKGPEPFKFTIPTEWWQEAEMESFEPIGSSFSHKERAELLLIPITSIMPFNRDVGEGGFRDYKMKSVLKKIRSSIPQDPIEIVELEERSEYQYRLYDGYHRFCASIAAGFSLIPAIVRDELEQPTVIIRMS